MNVYRIIDANINRVAEGLRVIEDIERFIFQDKEIAREVREIRHLARKSFQKSDLLSNRNSLTDIGLRTSQESDLDKKNDIKTLLAANFKRVEEGLRSIEECLKVADFNHEAKLYEQLRFKVYDLEKKAFASIPPDTDVLGTTQKKVTAVHKCTKQYYTHTSALTSTDVLKNKSDSITRLSYEEGQFMTQLDRARCGEITPAMQEVALQEGIKAEQLRELLAKGLVVIPSNKNHKSLRPRGFGQSMRTKVNANLGTSPTFPDWKNEIKKLEIALLCEADAVMDLSTGGDIQLCRREIIARSPVPVGTVPIYEAAVMAREQRSAVVNMDPDDLFAVIAAQARDGVDFVTVHCGVTRRIVENLKEHPRLLGIVSRGGAITAGWMLHNKKENPLYEQFDRLLEICKEHDVTISLGDGLRPGCLDDATDSAQIEELIILGELVQRSRLAGVQVMVEGPGHVPFDQIAANVVLQKKLCHGAPFYVLGPLVTDIAPGYDHIVSAIGGTVAAAAGADFLCYVTPAEHLGLPTADDVRDGVIASRIAAHAADIVKGSPHIKERDTAMAVARRDLNWNKQIELALNPEKASRIHQALNPIEQGVCSMCGEFCAIDLVNHYLKNPQA